MTIWTYSRGLLKNTHVKGVAHKSVGHKGATFIKGWARGEHEGGAVLNYIFFIITVI